MIKKIFTVAIATVTLATSCQSDYIDMPSDSLTAETKVMSRSAGFSFPDGWQYLETNDERWAALQIPEDMLSTMSTEDLVEACMTYPLALDCFAYNNVESGVAAVISHFNGFTELKKREYAFDKVLDFYDRKLEEIEMFGNTAGYTFKPFSLAFYELFIASGYLCPSGELCKSEKLINLYYKANDIHNSFEELQGHTALESISSLKDALNLDKKSRTIASSTYVTVYTKKGLSVIALKTTCYNPQAEITEGHNYIKNEYPLATIIEDATCAYNCHAYAWYVSEGGAKYWINQTHNGSENVSKFWADGTYKETKAAYAQKVFYPVGDHSAIAESSSAYVSKWGRMPLVRHASNYGPYNLSGLRYFTKDFTAPGVDGNGNGDDKDPNVDPPFKTGKVYWNMFPDPTPLYSYEDFSIDDSYDSSRFRVDIFVSNPKEQDEPIEDSSRAYVTSRTDRTATVYFASPGIYYVCFHVYSKATGNCVAKYISEEVYVQA
ncbi:MAG: hypothetical protein K2N08_09105 [Muribaculaceae bacterium]|nr:hypothetical protein [Muribaculaceae bacterium]